MGAGVVDIDIDPADGVPIYRQIAARMRDLVAAGVLEPETALPSIRLLAIELKVAPNTIAKAYEKLEAQGVVHKRRGLGTFVSSRSPHFVPG
jgi:GntR family transcriptional regulator